MAKRKGGAACSAAGKTAKGRLKKGYRWAKGRKGCPIKAKGKTGAKRKGRKKSR